MAKLPSVGELPSFAGVKPEPINLSHEERCRFFYFARWNAYQSLMMGVQSKKLSANAMVGEFQREAMLWLEVAREVFPLTKDRDTCSIEDILNGKEPEPHG